MLRDDLTPMQYHIRFTDSGVERVHYSDDRRYFEKLVASHGRLGGLQIEPLVLTGEQQQRLDNLPPGMTPHDASVYVRYGTAESEDSPHFDDALIIAYRQDQAEPKIKAQRKAAESIGVVHNGIRYHGDPSNRQALSEALQAAADGGMTAFADWKDSDGHYHKSVPAKDVEAALRKIGQRRAALIGLEAKYVAQVATGDADIMALDWTTPHD